MCKFFSVITDRHKNIYYADWKVRTKCLEYNKEWDSHAALAEYINIPYAKYNSYEINPWTSEVCIDSQMLRGGLQSVKDWFKTLNRKQLCPFMDFRQIAKPAKTKALTNDDLVNIYNYYIIDKYSAKDIMWQELTFAEATAIYPMLNALTAVLETILAYDTDSNLCSVALGSYLKLKDWHKINSSTITATDLSKFKNLDIGKNPYGCADYLWKRGLFPSKGCDGSCIVENVDAKILLNIHPSSLSRKVKNIE